VKFEFGDCGVDFEDQTRRRRHDHTVDKLVKLAAGGKHYIDENCLLQQPARIIIYSLSQHQTVIYSNAI